MKKLISFRRNKSVPIFYTQAVRKPSGINLLINDHRVLPRSREERLKMIPISVRGTLDADIIDEIKSTDEDPLLIKRCDSAFQDTEIGVWRSTAYEFRCVKVCAVDQAIYLIPACDNLKNIKWTHSFLFISKLDSSKNINLLFFPLQIFVIYK